MLKRYHALVGYVTVNLVAMLAMTGPAYAYLDPGTGSMMLQLLLGGVAGGLVLIKLYWTRFKEIISRLSDSGPPSDSPDKNA